MTCQANSIVRIVALTGAFALITSPVWASSEGGEAGFLGIPILAWKIFNFVFFFGLMIYFLARPLRSLFHSRSQAISAQLQEATRQRQEAERMRAETESKVAALAGEIKGLQERLRAEGVKDREALEKLGDAEVVRLLAQIDQEAIRRVDAARDQLAREAAHVAADIARDLLERELTAEDRERIFRRTLDHLRQSDLGGTR